MSTAAVEVLEVAESAGMGGGAMNTTTANPIVAFVVAWQADHAGADCPLSRGARL